MQIAQSTFTPIRIFFVCKEQRQKCSFISPVSKHTFWTGYIFTDQISILLETNVHAAFNASQLRMRWKNYIVLCMIDWNAWQRKWDIQTLQWRGDCDWSVWISHKARITILNWAANKRQTCILSLIRFIMFSKVMIWDRFYHVFDAHAFFGDFLWQLFVTSLKS